MGTKQGGGYGQEELQVVLTARRAADSLERALGLPAGSIDRSVTFVHGRAQRVEFSRSFDEARALYERRERERAREQRQRTPEAPAAVVRPLPSAEPEPERPSGPWMWMHRD